MEPHTHGYPRAGFYLVAAAFKQAGMSGLLDDKRGRRGPVKLTAEIVEFLRAAGPVGRPRAPSSPSRSPTGSGCIGAPWNGPAGGEHTPARLADRRF